MLSRGRDAALAFRCASTNVSVYIVLDLCRMIVGGRPLHRYDLRGCVAGRGIHQ